jgi:hypothetical protein
MWHGLVSIALAGAPNSDEPPRLYLQAAQVRQELHQALPAWAPCFAEAVSEDQEFRLTLSFHPEGHATDPVLVPRDSAKEACLALALESQRFPPHHEDPISVSTILVPRAGVLVPHPTVELSQRPDALLFVYVADPTQAEALRLALEGGDAAE